MCVSVRVVIFCEENVLTYPPTKTWFSVSLFERRRSGTKREHALGVCEERL